LLRGSLAILFALGAVTSVAPQSSSDDVPAAALSAIRPEALRAHMDFLADDLLEGRGTGTRGHLIAAHYVASQIEALGFLPAGDGASYFQRVPFRRAQIVNQGTSLSLDLPKGGKKLVPYEDFVAMPGLLLEHAVAEGRAAYVGYGVSAPGRGHDDYAGVDVRGRVVVCLLGAPASFPADERAYYSSTTLKTRTAASRGAVGVLTLVTPESEKRRPFARFAADHDRVSMDWMDGETPGDQAPGVQARAVLSRRGAEILFTGAPRTLEAAFEEAAQGKVDSFDLPATVRLRVESRQSSFDSPNVLGLLRGSDPELAKEFVVLSAHLDHLGIGTPKDGDSIYNGAFDNASGVAAMLEVARGLAGLPRRPRRSILFAAVTGEEKGLLGAEYWARHPTVGPGTIVADLNADMFLTLFPVKDVVVLGGEHSSLGATVGALAPRLGLEVSPDPFPEEVLFIRSDHYAFVQQGIPSIMLDCGLHSADAGIDGARLVREWMATRYHSPRDDMRQVIDFDSAAKIARLYLLIAARVADDDRRPAWNAGDFFAEKFARPPADR
jgi:Zn-dependent M28 family amino/carboxypeptidase